MPFTLAIVALVLVQIWILQPVAGERWVPVVATGVVVLGVVHAWRSGDWGWSSRAFVPGLVAVALFTALLASALVSIGSLLGVARSRDISIDGLGWLLVWGGAQQWLLQTTFLREAERFRTGRRLGWLAAPVLFGVLHLPNPFLTVVTTAAAIGGCAIYRRFPNVVPLALSHAVGTRVILLVFDEATTGRLRVGASYLGL